MVKGYPCRVTVQKTSKSDANHAKPSYNHHIQRDPTLGFKELSECFSMKRYPLPMVKGLQLALMANREFWSKRTIWKDKSTAPTKHEVVSFLRSRGASKNLAESIDKVLRPTSLKCGGRPRSGNGNHNSGPLRSLFFCSKKSVINKIKNSGYRFKTVGTVFPACCFTVFTTGIRRINEVKHSGNNQKNSYPSGSKRSAHQGRQFATGHDQRRKIPAGFKLVCAVLAGMKMKCWPG